MGTEKQELAAHFLGGRPQLKSTAVLCSDASQRFHLVTVGSGTVSVCRCGGATERRGNLTAVRGAQVHFQLDVMLKHFDASKLEWR
jgi:hypothetical protein